MNTILVLSVGPLVLGTVLYLMQAGAYQFVLDRPWMFWVFIGYSIANVGLIGDAISQGALK